MNVYNVLRFVFAAAILVIMIMGLRMYLGIDESFIPQLGIIFWLPAGSILLYTATHLLNRTKGKRFYVLQIVGVGLLQFLVGVLALHDVPFWPLVLPSIILILISLFGYLNVYIAFLVKDRSPGWLYVIAPIGLITESIYSGGFWYLVVLVPISLLNFFLLRQKS